MLEPDSFGIANYTSEVDSNLEGVEWTDEERRSFMSILVDRHVFFDRLGAIEKMVVTSNKEKESIPEAARLIIDRLMTKLIPLIF